ncbi:dCTP deaminase [candidate division WOR-3 bacterium]|nr:dCTP deaminase [candidate division WOR-3 bacterium]
MVLSDVDILRYIMKGRLVIIPFTEKQVRENGIDLRLGEGWCMLREVADVLDPYDPEENLDKFYVCKQQKEFVLQPYRRYLLTTMEHIKLPPELMGFVELRSTFARLGFIIPPTIIDGGFEGQITIEVMAPPFPVWLKAGTRFLHIVFDEVSSPIHKPYSGKYQGQKGVTLPKLPP